MDPFIFSIFQIFYDEHISPLWLKKNSNKGKEGDREYRQLIRLLPLLFNKKQERMGKELIEKERLKM